LISGLLLNVPIFSTKDDENIEKGKYRKSGRYYHFDNRRIELISTTVNKMTGVCEDADLEGYGATPGKEQTFYLGDSDSFPFLLPEEKIENEEAVEAEIDTQSIISINSFCASNIVFSNIFELKLNFKDIPEVSMEQIGTMLRYPFS